MPVIGTGIEKIHVTDESGARRVIYFARRVEAVYLLKIDFGPVCRVYSGKDGERIVILPGGSSKKREGAAFAASHAVWVECKRSEGGDEASARRSCVT